MISAEKKLVHHVQTVGMLLQGSSCRQVTHRRVVCDNVFLTPRRSNESPMRSNHGEMLVSIPQTIKKKTESVPSTPKSDPSS